MTDPIEHAALPAAPQPVDRVLVTLEQGLSDARRCRDTQAKILAGYEQDILLFEALISDHSRRIRPSRVEPFSAADAPPEMRAALAAVPVKSVEGAAAQALPGPTAEDSGKGPES